MSRRAMRRASAVVVWLLFVLLAPAVAADELADYVVIYRPGETYNVTLKLSYSAAAEPKTGGFKFFGTTSIDAYAARSLTNAYVHISSTSGFREQRLDWWVPAADPETGLQTVLVDIRQRQDERYGWFTRRVSIPWAHQFKIPVRAMEFRVKVPAGTSLQGAECKTIEAATYCAWRKDHAFVINGMPLAASNEVPGLAFAALLVAAMLYFGSRMLRQLQEQLLLEKGVLPPAEEEAYPELPKNYRAPPPLPKPIEVEPQLPEEDAKALRTRTGVALLVAVVPTLGCATIGNGLSPIPMSWLLVVVLVGSAIIAGALLRKPDASYAPLMWGAGTAMGIGAVAAGAAVWVAGAAGVVLVIYLLSKVDWSNVDLSSGGSGSSYSSCSSFSSCGSSGSSCGSSSGSSCGGCGG